MPFCGHHVSRFPPVTKHYSILVGHDNIIGYLTAMPYMWAAYREWNRMTGFSTIWRTYKPAAIYTVRRRINRINIITIIIRYPTLAHNFASCWPIFKQNYFTTRRAQTSAKADSMHSSSIVDIVLDCILASYSHFDCDPTPPTWPLPISWNCQSLDHDCL